MISSGRKSSMWLLSSTISLYFVSYSEKKEKIFCGFARILSFLSAARRKLGTMDYYLIIRSHVRADDKKAHFSGFK